MNSVLILGGSSDIGKSCAYLFAERGFDIILTFHKEDKNFRKMVSELLELYQVNIKSTYFDALNFNEHKKFYNTLETSPGIVINTFGYLGDNNLATHNFEEAYKIIATNLIGNISILNIIADDMQQRKSGSIICISSVAGERGRKNNYIYGSSKSGLTTYLSGLRNRLYPFGVYVTTIIPGFVKTKMIKDLKTSNLLTASPDRVALAIWKSYKRKKNIVYVLPVWRFIMFIIKNIPEGFFKKMNL